MDPPTQHELDYVGAIDQEIELLSHELSQTPDGDPNKRHLLICLGKTHDIRFDLLDEGRDIQKVIEYANILLGLIPEDDPGLRGLRSTLGIAHTQCFRRLADVNDIEKGIEFNSLALEMTPDDHPDLPQYLSNLVVSHKDRFELLNELDDIEKAIEYGARAVVTTSKDDPMLPERLAKLGTSYEYRFERLGDLNDLEKAVDYQSVGLEIAPDDFPYLPTMLANLGSSHSSRFQRLGGLDDLSKAIAYRSRALELTPDGHPSLPSHLANLGVSHQHRFERMDEMNDLREAIEYKTRALELTPDDHPDLPDRLANLGVSHLQQFERLGDLDDLDKSMEYHSRALAMTPDGHPHLSTHLANLAVCYQNRFSHLQHPVDLDKAIEYEARALAAISDDHSDSCRWHFNHALSHIRYYELSNDTFHLKQSLNHFRISSTLFAGAPRDKFKNARDWAAFASKYSALDPIEAYQTAIDLLPQFIWLGATTDQRYDDLLMAETLAVDAARAAILSSNHYLALEWLEHTRCIVWNQNLALRSSIDQLKASHSSLTARLKLVADELHSTSLGSRDLPVSSFSITTSEEAGQRRRHLAEEYNKLVDQVRTLPEFKEFFQPMKFNGLVRAAQNGPIAVVNCHEDRCDVLLILPDQNAVTHLPLPGFNGGKARRVGLKIRSSVGRQGLRERGWHPLRELGVREEFASALTTLWNELVQPVLNCLGYMNHAPTDCLPHITWCPTGPASFLPLHAAGDYGQPDEGERIFNYVISSYTPTLTALLATTPSTLDGSSRVLAIGQAATPGHRPLPETSTELGYVKSHVEGRVEYLQLMDAQATPSTVLDAMEKHDWVHLACHAHQNINDPTRSGFFLHGDIKGTEATLDLTAINRQSFKHKGLAFLSACQTATGDETLPDEAVHLASGMLMAGYSSVIATMWSVVDEDAPYVADKVYGQLMVEGKLGNGEAGKALHDAVAGLREKVGEKAFGRWVPYIHIGS